VLVKNLFDGSLPIQHYFIVANLILSSTENECCGNRNNKHDTVAVCVTYEVPRPYQKQTQTSRHLYHQCALHACYLHSVPPPLHTDNPHPPPPKKSCMNSWLSISGGVSHTGTWWARVLSYSWKPSWSSSRQPVGEPVSSVRLHRNTRVCKSFLYTVLRVLQ